MRKIICVSNSLSDIIRRFLKNHLGFTGAWLIWKLAKTWSVLGAEAGWMKPGCLNKILVMSIKVATLFILSLNMITGGLYTKYIKIHPHVRLSWMLKLSIGTKTIFVLGCKHNMGAYYTVIERILLKKQLQGMGRVKNIDMFKCFLYKYVYLYSD